MHTSAPQAAGETECRQGAGWGGGSIQSSPPEPQGAGQVATATVLLALVHTASLSRLRHTTNGPTPLPPMRPSQRCHLHLCAAHFN